MFDYYDNEDAGDLRAANAAGASEARAEEEEEEEANRTCSACSGDSRPSKDGHHRVCLRCGGRFGTVTYEYYRTLVKNEFVTEDPPRERYEYFDFTILGKAKNGVYTDRFHGWRDKETGKVYRA